MKRIVKILFILCGFLGLLSCEEEVMVDLQDAPPVLAVDAWVNDKPEDQVIRLTLTQPYFDNSVPEGIEDAEVTVTDDQGQVYPFVTDGNGKYVWSYDGEHTFGAIGRAYQLTIAYDGNVYSASSAMGRVPVVDSVFYTLQKEDDALRDKGYYAQFHATDFVGEGDAYWIKSYKNGQLLLRPFELNIAFDAGFSEGGNIDGVVFIQPIQDAVTPLNEDLDGYVPFDVGDSLYVEVYSITPDTYNFLSEVAIQTQRDGGFDEIFAEPMENVPCNILKASGPSDEPVVGYFSVSAVAGNGRRLTPD